MFDPVSQAILETIGAAGYAVHIHDVALEAQDLTTSERFIVRYHQDTFYDAVIELAIQTGIELEDG